MSVCRKTARKEGGEEKGSVQHQHRLPNMNGVPSILTHPHFRKHSKSPTKIVRKKAESKRAASTGREASRRV